MRRTDKNTVTKEKKKAERMSGLTAGKKRFIKRKLCDENPTVCIGISGAAA
jgi:hypothetical protein